MSNISLLCNWPVKSICESAINRYNSENYYYCFQEPETLIIQLSLDFPDFTGTCFSFLDLAMVKY